MVDGFSAGIAPQAEEGATSASQRTRDRDSLFLTSRLRLAGEKDEHEVRIRNLSAGGMMAELGRTVAVGTAVTLQLRGIGEVAGRIAWSAEGRAGIALDVPIDPKRARKPVGGGKQTPIYARAPRA